MTDEEKARSWKIVIEDPDGREATWYVDGALVDIARPEEKAYLLHEAEFALECVLFAREAAERAKAGA